jgi:alpha-N-arabinofuranosidase
MYGKRRSGISLQAAVSGPGYEGKTNGPVAYIDTSAILNGSQLNLFTTNRSLDETVTVHLNLADRAIVALDSAEILTGPDPKALNTYEQPNLIRAQPFQSVKITAGGWRKPWLLSCCSWEWSWSARCSTGRNSGILCRPPRSRRRV